MFQTLEVGKIYYQARKSWFHMRRMEEARWEYTQYLYLDSTATYMYSTNQQIQESRGCIFGRSHGWHDPQKGV